MSSILTTTIIDLCFVLLFVFPLWSLAFFEDNVKSSKSKSCENPKAAVKQVNQKVSGKCKAANHLASASCTLYGKMIPFPQVLRLPLWNHLSHRRPESPLKNRNRCPLHLRSHRRSPIGPPFHIEALLLPSHPKNQLCKSTTSAPPAMVANTTASTASDSQSEDLSSTTPLSSFHLKASTNGVAAEFISTIKKDTTPTEAGDSTSSAPNNTTPTRNKTPTAGTYYLPNCYG